MSEVVQEAKKTSWKKLPEAVRRDAILNAAQICFAKKGFSDTSVNDIAKASGLTKGGIYFHFESKEDIRKALIENFISGMQNAVDEIKSTGDKQSNKLCASISLLIDRMGEDNGLLLTVAEAVTRHGNSISEIREYYQSLGHQIAEIIVIGRANGEFKNESEVELLVELILATISGISLHREMDRAGVDLCTNKHKVVDYLVSIVTQPCL